MNVLIVSEPGSSGVFTYVEALCHHLIEHGVRVHLGYSDRRGSDRLDMLVRHVESHGGLTANMEVGSGAGPADMRAFLRLRGLAWRARPDVVHCHSSKAGVLGRALALAGVRASFLYHPHAYYGMRPGRRHADLAYDLIEAFLGRVGTTIVVSRDEWRFAEEWLGVPPSRLRLIQNGVDIGHFREAPPPEKLALRNSFGIPPRAVVLGSISRLSPQKDPHTLYTAFAAAAAKRPNIHLFHVGTGEKEGEVDQLVAELGIGDRVTRLRYLTNPIGFYNALDGFILTSTYEGLSLASLEAVSCNLPMILSRAPGNIDLLELPLSHAWGAEPGNIGQFASCIAQWHDSSVAGTRPNHSAIARDRFDSRRTQGVVLSLYGSMVARAARAREAWLVRLPVIAWLLIIATESTDRFSRANTRRMLYPFFNFLTGVSYGEFDGWNHVIRKTGHVVGYGVLSALLYRLARFEYSIRYVSASRPQCAAVALLGTILVASLDEWHQTWIPSRTGTLSDVVLDSCAGLVVLMLIVLFSAQSGGRAPVDGLGRSRSGQSPRSRPTGSVGPGLASEPETQSRRAETVGRIA